MKSFFRNPLAKKEAFSVVIDRELSVLYRVAKRLTLNPTHAEDLVGQTMLLAATHWENFDGRYPRSWLIQILRNEWMNTVRKGKVRREVDIDAVLEPAEDDFWCAIDHSLDAETIIAALDKLPEEYRLAVTLCDVEELSYDEAAMALGVPVGTIRSRLFRGRKILRSRLVHLDLGTQDQS